MIPSPNARSDGQIAHANHLNDPAKGAEHMALMDLVPTAQATHVAVKSGSWFDPATWGGTIPGAAAKVWIPQNIQVDYDGVSEQRLFTLRVDGQLDFATDQETQIILDTFVVAPEGTLTIGTEDNPVQGNARTRILIADNGAIDTVWDPQQLSRGVISHGTVSIHSQTKTSHLKVAAAPLAGDRTLRLAEIPNNWQVGDRILLTGTRYVPYSYSHTVGDWVYPGTEDEQRVITAIDGDRITLDRPLDYDHTGPKSDPKSDLKAYVANQSRNVVIETENAASLPANQRGHVMLMHSDSIDVRYAEFKELGRTDKSKLLDDFQIDENYTRLEDSEGNPIPGDRTNIRGRYALHLHRTGVNGEQQPAVIVGNSIDGSPGWGITQHDSYAVLENNLTYNVTGAGFVSETGNEIGAWRDNISIRNNGGRNENEKLGDGNQDLGFDGHGFWFQSRLVENEGNVTAGNRGSGIFYFHRGKDQIDVDGANLPLQAWAKGQQSVDTSDPPIMGFANNEVFASENGLTVIKNFQRQEHDGRTVLDGFKAWEIAKGVQLQYTAHYTLKDFDLQGAKTVNRSWLSDGFELAQNTEDIVFDKLTVEGFDRGVSLQKKIAGEAPLDDWGYVWVDAQVQNNQQDWVNFDPTVDRLLSRADVNLGQLSFDLDTAKSQLVIGGRDDGYFATIEGTKIDSLGAIDAAFGSELLAFHSDGLNSIVAEGYYTLPNGEKGIVVDEYFSDRLTGDARKYSFVLTFRAEDDFWTQGVPNLGPLDPSQIENVNGIVDFDSFTLAHPSFVDGSSPTPIPTPDPSPDPAPVPDPIPDPIPSPTPGATIGEYDTVTLSQGWQSITLNNTYINPVVIVSEPTFTNSDPATVRVRNAMSNQIQLRLQEPNYADGVHPQASVSYLVMEAGDWTLADGTRISAGVHNTNRLTSRGFDTVALDGFQQTPTILSQVQSFNGRDWVTTRLKQQSERSFQLAMQEEEALNRGGHVSESVGWVAIEQGVADDGDTLLEGGTTARQYDHTGGQVQFQADFSEGLETAPSVIAKLGSFYGPDTANLRLDSLDTNSLGTTGFRASVREEQSLDAELGHTRETVSFLALEGVSGLLTGFVNGS